MRTTIIACAVTALVVGGGTATAQQAGLLSSKDIRDDSIQNRDVRSAVLTWSKLAPTTRQKIERLAALDEAAAADSRGLEGAQGPRGAAGPRGETGAPGRDGAPGLADLEADGPYPGSSNLAANPGQGANSSARWTSGPQRQSSWVQCPEGKVALGGGFGDDSTSADERLLTIVTSAPAQIRNGQLVYEPIPGDAAGSVQPNGWVVFGYNETGRTVTVRPHVICARVAGRG